LLKKTTNILSTSRRLIFKMENSMKKHKKDLSHRAFVRGYQTAIQQRSISTCPYQTESELGFQWCTGWRQGRADYWSGFSQATMQQKAGNL
jgi:ribosome modulation factor